MSTPLFVVLLLSAAAFGVFLWVRLPQLTGARSGRVLLLLALLVMPILLIQLGVARTLTGSKQKEFCTSCHEMEVYDTSLRIDDPEFVPANHFQNRLVPQETACYTCHTDYTLYGDISAKLNGLKHVWVHYFGDVPPPGEIALYTPYPNDNCLQCHRGGRNFEKKRPHTTEGVTLELLYSNQKSCVGKGCHDKIHDIDHLAEHDLWGEAPWPIPEVLKQKAKEGPAAEDPFAEDPFADEPAKPGDAPDAGSKPATAVENPDDLWDDEPAAPADAQGPAAPGGGDDAGAPAAPEGGDDAGAAPAPGTSAPEDAAPAAAPTTKPEGDGQ
ncbi:MAG: NapC/NirT family cytochrome c [Deltaproteobacteria bacterium]|nr:NapC/NirT family cytochrome c [Deltaproteobacteria bacterium]